MTPPPEDVTVDPSAVILARMEVKLDNALEEQKRHTSMLDRHDSILGEHGNRITAVETQLSAQADQAQANTGGKTVLWAAASALASIAAVVLAVLLAVHG